jgi:hypothetical protein
VVAGVVYDPASGTNNAMVRRFDSDGNSLWSVNFGSAGHEYVFDVCPTSDAGFALAGGFWTPESQFINAYLAKTDSSGHTTPVGISRPPEIEVNAIRPNPVSGTFTIQAGEPVLRVMVSDLHGRLVLDSGTLPPGSQLVTGDLSGFPPGIYLVRIRTAGGTITRKLVRQ